MAAAVNVVVNGHESIAIIIGSIVPVVIDFVVVIEPTVLLLPLSLLLMQYLLFTDDALEALVVPLPCFVLHLFHAGPERLSTSVTPNQNIKLIFK